MVINLDSAVPAEAMSEEQTFRSELSLSLRLIRCGGNRSLPLSGHRSAVVKMKSKTYNGEARSSEKDFETLQCQVTPSPAKRERVGVRVGVL
jgi:hypothetical protein